MSIQNSIVLEPWIRAFDFAGRSRRREFFIFYGEFFAAIFLTVFIFSGQIDSNSFDRMPVAVQTGFGVLVFIAMIPGLSLQVRRLHDQNRSGWWIFLNAVPFVGHFIMLMLMLWEGTPGDDRFGHSPRHK
jgi:uncharacterized membrane protein YhaH (DUF805 family)